MHIVKTIVPYNYAFQCHVDDLKTLALGSLTFLSCMPLLMWIKIKVITPFLGC